MAQLTAPTITAVLSSNGTDIQISGITSQNASGYKVRWGTLSGYGREESITPTSGSYTIDDTFARTTYFVAVQAVGDGVDYEDSGWSNEVTVVTEGTEDSSIAVPSPTLNTTVCLTYVQVLFGTMGARPARRYQLSTSESDLATQRPGVANGWTSQTNKYNSRFAFCDLTPGTTYYARFCQVEGKRCGAWSSVYTFTTPSVDGSTVVTNTNNSGSGSLQQAGTDSLSSKLLITFDVSLDGQTIYMGNNWTSFGASAGCIVDASALPNGIIIDGSNVESITFDCLENVTWKNVVFKNIIKTSSSNAVFDRGSFIDCVFDSCGGSTSGVVGRAVLCRCQFKDCHTGTGKKSLVYQSYVRDSIVKDNTDTTKSFYIGRTSNFNNCYFGGNTNVIAFGTDEASQQNVYTDCVIVGNTVAGYGALLYGGGAANTFWRNNTCTLTTNTVSPYSDNAPFQASTLWYCWIEGTTRPSSGYLVTSRATSKVVTGCTIKTNYYCGGGTWDRCILISDNLTGEIFRGGYWQGGSSETTFKNCLLYGRLSQGSVTIINSMLYDLYYSGKPLYNSLVGPSSRLSYLTGSNNIVWNESDPSNANYIDKIVTDAAHGDWTLCKDSPAINTGDDQYVTSGDLDLAGQPRINGTAVDVGAYEFYSSQLDPPTYTIQTGAGGSGSVAFTLPEGGVSFRLESDTDNTFSNPRQYTSSASPLTISGYSGTVFFRAKTIGATADEDSDWTSASTAFFDATPPTVTPKSNPFIINLGEVWNLITKPFTTRDDTDALSALTRHYYLYDGNNELVTINGVSEDIPSANIPSGVYTLQLRATDTAGNVGIGNTTLIVCLAPPTYTITTGPGGTATISGTLPAGASGWTVAYVKNEGSWQDQVWTYVENAANPLILEGLDGEWLFNVQAVSPTGTYNSPWAYVSTVNLDAYPPVLTIPEAAVDMTVGASVDLFDGVSAVDNQDPAPTISYTIQDANGQTVEIGGQTQDLDTADLDPGVYTINYTAEDEAGNVGTATRALKVRLAAPTYEITTGANGTATISYTLPAGAVGCDILPLFSESFNPPVWIHDAPNPCIVTGLNGPYVFYFVALSPTNDYNSKTIHSRAYWLDNNTPVVTVEDRSPLEYVVGDETVTLLSGVTATDDHDATVPLVYYLTDSNGDIVDVDGVRQNIPSQNIPIGGYKIVYEATDTAGNKGHNDRGLLVLPTVLSTPSIACVGLYNTTATIGGLNVEHAYSYALDVDGVVTTIDPPANGTYAITNLADNASHVIKVKALGDWIIPEPPTPPSGHYRDSAWSNSVTVVIGNPASSNAPVITKTNVTDRAITFTVSNYEQSAGFFEIVISESPNFTNLLVLTKVPADEITVGGLKASTIYWIKLRAVFAESTTPFSNPLVAQTAELSATTTADKLLYVRQRIQMLRDYLAEVSNFDTVTIDGISETHYDREKLLKELAELEGEESRLANGGGRLRTMDIRWVIR